MSLTTVRLSQKRRLVDGEGDVDAIVDGDQANGGRVAKLGFRRVRGKYYDPSKIFKGMVKHHKCHLGLRRDCVIEGAALTGYPDSGGLFSRYMVSEYNPGRGGCVPISFDSGIGITPMHCIDLNFLAVGHDGRINTNYEDSIMYSGEKATTQNQDVNARFWIWGVKNGSAAGASGPMWLTIPRTRTSTTATTEVTCRPRWTWEPQTDDMYTNSKVYKRSIDCRMNLYGCSRMQTEFDVRVIRIIDPEMCPDYEENLPAGDGGSGGTNHRRGPNSLAMFRARWSDLVRPFITNPLIKGLDPVENPALRKQWFETVYKKRVRMNEQTGYGNEGGPPVAQLGFTIPINELMNFQWDYVNTDEPLYDAPYYNDVPGRNVAFQKFTPSGVADVPDNLNISTSFTTGGLTYNARPFQQKPHYKNRLYLLIRAVAPRDVQPSTTNIDEETGTGSGVAVPTGGNFWGGDAANAAPAVGEDQLYGKNGGYFSLRGLKPPQMNAGTEIVNSSAVAFQSFDFMPSYDLVLTQNYCSAGYSSVRNGSVNP